MVVKAYQLAAKGLAQEIQSCSSALDLERIPDLSAALESCLQELQGLQSAFVMCPTTGASGGDILSSVYH